MKSLEGKNGEKMFRRTRFSIAYLNMLDLKSVLNAWMSWLESKGILQRPGVGESDLI